MTANLDREELNSRFGDAFKSWFVETCITIEKREISGYINPELFKRENKEWLEYNRKLEEAFKK